jgi:hypothetical protein
MDAWDSMACGGLQSDPLQRPSREMKIALPVLGLGILLIVALTIA